MTFEQRLAEAGQRLGYDVGSEPDAEKIGVMLAGYLQAQGFITVEKAKVDRLMACWQAAKAVCEFDWSDNDTDAVATIDTLRASLRAGHHGS